MTPPGEMISPGPLKVKEERFRVRRKPDTEPLFFDSRTLFEKTGKTTGLSPYEKISGTVFDFVLEVISKRF